MNSYVGMTMVKKEQGQDDYFNQQSILLTFTCLHKCYSSEDLCRLVMWEVWFVDWNNCLVPVLFLTIVINSYIAVHFIEMLFITCYYYSTNSACTRYMQLHGRIYIFRQLSNAVRMHVHVRCRCSFALRLLVNCSRCGIEVSTNWYGLYQYKQVLLCHYWM